MLAYLRRCLVAARSKLTTWVALVTANLALVPVYIQDYWGQLESQYPRLGKYHHGVIAFGIILLIWTRIRREAKAVAPILLCLLLALPALAQAAGPTATLTWVAPTTNTDGTPITGALTYNVYQGPTGAEGTTPVQTSVSGTSLTVTAGLTDGTTVCWKITAVEGGQESAKSNEACKTFPPATPNGPTNLAVQ